MTASLPRTSSGVPSPMVRPSASTWMRSQSRMISRRSWSTISTPQPRSSRTRRIDASRSSDSCSFIPAAGSSSSRKRGRPRARARSRRGAADRRRASSPRGPAAGQAELIQQLVDRRVDAARQPADAHVLLDGHAGEEPDLLERAPDAEPRELVRRPPGRVRARRQRSGPRSAAVRRRPDSRAWSCRCRSVRSARRSRPRRAEATRRPAP